MENITEKITAIQHWLELGDSGLGSHDILFRRDFTQTFTRDDVTTILTAMKRTFTTDKGKIFVDDVVYRCIFVFDDANILQEVKC